MFKSPDFDTIEAEVVLCVVCDKLIKGYGTCVVA